MLKVWYSVVPKLSTVKGILKFGLLDGRVSNPISRMSQTRNFDSSMLTMKKGIRAVYANNLAQNTAVNAGKRLAVTSVSGPASSDNSFTIAIETGSTDLTPAEFASIVNSVSPGSARSTQFFKWGNNSSSCELHDSDRIHKYDLCIDR